MSDTGQLIHRETAELQRQLRTLPFFQALHAGDLPHLAIVSFLRCLSIVHGALERSAAEAACPPVARLFEQVKPKAPLLQADLDALNSAGLPSVSVAIRSALAYAADIVASAENPATLSGVLYALERMLHDEMMLNAKPDYARCLDISEERLSYVGCYDTAAVACWGAFVDRVNSIPFSGAQICEVVRAAKACFQQIEAICAGLCPYTDKDLGHHITTINFEAGAHAMPQSPLEIDLALRAGNAAWEQYPYLRLRFGERGKRFTASDSCWLFALTKMPTETVTRSLAWLRTVLASRGIPTVILEEHLRIIGRALGDQFPDQIEARTRFDQFLTDLDAERQAHIDTLTMSRLIESFDQRFGDCDGLRVDSTARLIISAWSDERSGIAGALAATRAWFVDRERFSSDWVFTVEALVEKLEKAGLTSC